MLLNYLRLMRPADWVKNIFILPAIVFSIPALISSGETERIPSMILATVWTVISFSLLSSAVYSVNDSIDYERDKLHPVKRRRPIAAGLIAPRSALIFGILLGILSLCLGFMMTNKSVGVCLITYIILQLIYNCGFKRLVVVDASLLAIGFSLRAGAGAFAIRTDGVSVWLLGLVFFITLYLAFIKRRCDLATAGAANANWTSPAGYDNPLELNWLLSLSGVSVVLSWVLYSLSPHAQAVFGIRAVGFAILTPLVLIVVHRFYQRSQRGKSESPLAAFLEDRVIAVCMLLFVIGVLVSLYVPWVETSLLRLIYVDGTGPAS